jgi:hypothetical protein
MMEPLTPYSLSSDGVAFPHTTAVDLAAMKELLGNMAGGSESLGVRSTFIIAHPFPGLNGSPDHLWRVTTTNYADCLTRGS